MKKLVIDIEKASKAKIANTMQNSVVQKLDKAEADFTKIQRKVEKMFKKILSDSDLKKGLDNRYTGSLQSLSELQSKAKKRSFSGVINALNGLIVAARKMEPVFKSDSPASVGIKDEPATAKKVARVGQEAKQLKIEGLLGN